MNLLHETHLYVMTELRKIHKTDIESYKLVERKETDYSTIITLMVYTDKNETYVNKVVIDKHTDDIMWFNLYNGKFILLD